MNLNPLSIKKTRLQRRHQYPTHIKETQRASTME